MSDEPFIPRISSVNYHLWRPCNMRCVFCFATYDSTMTVEERFGLTQRTSQRLITKLYRAGFKKLTFAGGEPTLCPWLPRLVVHAKTLGLVVSLVTNGSRIDTEFVHNTFPYLDWLVLSIDSMSRSTNLRHGRAVNAARPIDTEQLLDVADAARQTGVRLKVNTVVTAANFQEVLNPLIDKLAPERWKIMQALVVRGENDNHRLRFEISKEEFATYVALNSPTPAGTTMIVENNDDMIDSYVMVDPLGRFISNSNGRYRLSQPILNVGVEKALRGMSYDYDKFERRGGVYDW